MRKNTRACPVCGKVVDLSRKACCSRTCSALMRTVPLEKRFWGKVDRTSEGCWPWLAGVDADGYGRINIEGSSRKAPRIAYELANSMKIPEGVNACHKCDNPICCNPEHIFLGTQTENIQDMYAKGREAKPPTEQWVGSKNAVAKLTETDVIQIRQAVGSCAEIALKFNVSGSTIARIRNRAIWKHVCNLSS